MRGGKGEGRDKLFAREEKTFGIDTLVTSPEKLKRGEGERRKKQVFLGEGALLVRPLSRRRFRITGSVENPQKNETFSHFSTQ